MTENLPQKMVYNSKNLHSAIEAMENEIVRLQRLLDESTGTIQKPVEYPLVAVLNQSVTTLGTPPYNSYGNNQPSPQLALTKLNRAYEDSKPLVEKNREICENNKKIVSRFIAMLTNAGFKTSETRYITVRGRSKMETIPAGWTLLGDLVSTSDKWPNLEQSYNNYKNKIAEWENNIKLEKEKAIRAEQQEKKEKEVEIRRIQACIQYQLDPTKNGFEDVLDAIINKNKYLYLAHYLQKNRNDWSEGPNYAEIGLNHFTKDTLDDLAIYSEIHDLIEDWGGDGRVFRDCNWNYNELFTLVPPDIMEEYKEIMKYISD